MYMPILVKFHYVIFIILTLFEYKHAVCVTFCKGASYKGYKGANSEFKKNFMILGTFANKQMIKLCICQFWLHFTKSDYRQKKILIFVGK